MEVIKDNYNKTVKCDHCHSLLKINKDDIDHGQTRYGACPCTIKCPVCNQTSMLDSGDPNYPNAYNINDVFR